MQESDYFERLKVLQAYQLIPTLPEKIYDDITRLAALICRTPICLITLFDNKRQFFKSHYGWAINELPVEHSFCTHTIKYLNEIFVIEDARTDSRFKDNPLVTDKPGIVFYAGVPLVAPSGVVLGTLCVMDHKFRKLDDEQIDALKSLAHQVMQLFELRRKTLELNESKAHLNRESERLHNIIEATQVGTWEWNVQTDEVHINERWAEILGYTKKELEPIGIETWYNVAHPDDIDFSDERVKECLDKKIEFYDIEYRMLHKDGHVVWINDRGRVVSRTDDDKPLIMAGTHTDITQRKIKEAQFNSITNNIPGVVFRYRRGPNGSDKMELVSEGAEGLWGISPAEAMQNNQLIWERYERDVPEHLKSAGHESFWEHEWRYHHPDGSTRWHKGTGNPTRMEDGSTMWDTIFLDITDRKRAEKELNISLKRFRSLVENAANAIVIISAEGKPTYASPSISNVLGYTEEEALELNLFEIIHPDDLEGIVKKMEEVLQKPGVTIDGQTSRIKHKDGSWRWLEASITNMLHDPAINGIVDNFRDVTETKKLQHLFDDASKLARVGSWEIDLTHSTVYLSEMTRDIHELDPDFEPSLNSGIHFYREDVRPMVSKTIEKAIKNGTPWDFELPIITAKGNERWVRSIGKPEMHDGKCVKLYGSFQDIHQQKSAELELQMAFEEKNNILESIGDAFFSMDKDWNVLYWNSRAEELIGVEREQIIGYNLWEIFPEARKSKFYTEYARAIRDQVSVHFEEYYTPLTIWLEVNGYPTADGISVFFRDITQRKLVQEHIRQSNERFEKIAEATNDAIWDYDIVNNQLFWGKGFTTLFGHDLNKITPTFDLMVSFIHPEDRPLLVDRMEQFINDADGINWFAEYRFQKSDGTYAFVIDRAIFIRNDKGKAIRAVGAMTDITYRLEYENSLRKLNQKLEARARELALSNAELEQFAYVASHDLQEPLRMVSSFLSQLEKRYGDSLDDKAHKYIHFAVDGAMRMRQIILDLLEFSRIGKYEEERGDVSLNTVIDEVRKLLQREIERSGATIHIGELPKVNFYKSPLIQIFQNLISNAIKYVKAGQSPEVYIKAEENKQEWQVSVSDNGIGIEPEYFDKIFVIFQRLHVKEQYSGTGMGLAIVKKNIESLGGRIWLESEEGKGTTFYFSIPKNHN